MKSNKTFIISAVIVLLLAQLLNAVLGSAGFEKGYKDTLMSRYGLLIRESKRQIETGLGFGKSIQRYAGMDTIFTFAKALDNKIEAIYVSDVEGTILYSDDLKAQDKEIAPSIIEDLKKQETLVLHEYKEKNILNYFLLSESINDSSGKVNAYIHFVIPSTPIKSELGFMVNQSIITGSLVFVGSVLLVLLAAYILSNLFSIKTNRAFKIFVALVLLSSQVVYAFSMNNQYQNAMISAYKENMQVFGRVLESYLTPFLDMGIKASKLKGAETLLSERLLKVNECAEIEIADDNGLILYRAVRDKNTVKAARLVSGTELLNIEENRKMEVMTGVFNIKQKSITVLANGKGYLTLRINNSLLEKTSLDLFLDTLTVIAVTLIISFQALLFFSKLSGKRKKEVLSDDEGFALIRISAFLLFLGELIALPFLPMMVKSMLVQGRTGASFVALEGAIGIPISAYLAGVSISVLTAGFLSSKIKAKNLLLAASACMTIGALGSALSNDILVFTLFRMLSGIGYGIGLAAGSALVISVTDDHNRATGFGQWSGGYAAAVICAVSIGGVIANRLGFKIAMLASACIAILLFIFTLFYVKAGSRVVEKKISWNFSDFFAPLLDRNLLANLFLSSIPFQLAYIGVFQYVLPLFMTDQGFSESTIGRIMMAFGLIYLLTPYIAKLADKVKNDRLFIIIGNIVVGLFMLLFAFSSSLIIIFVVIIALGFGTMIGDSVEESFIVSSKKSKKIGEAKLLSIYSTYEKIGASFVPAFTSILIATLGFKSSIVAVGLCVLCCTLFFSFITVNLRARIKSDGNGDKVL